MPTRLAARYEEARHDPDLISLHDDIAVVDSRLAELLERVSDDDPRIQWNRAIEALEVYKEAQQKGSRAQIGALSVLEQVLSEGLESPNGATWREVFGLLEGRRRLVDSESKRLQMLQQMIPTEKALVLIGLIVGIIKQYVTDAAQLNAISRAIDAITLIEDGR